MRKLKYRQHNEMNLESYVLNVIFTNTAVPGRQRHRITTPEDTPFAEVIY